MTHARNEPETPSAIKRRSQRYRIRRLDRAGYTLVLFLMLMFGLFGLAALVIDMGFARLAQTEMQTAVDSAALEGLRNGRQAASNVVGEMFTNSTDSSGQVRQFGAGPIVNFSGGIGDPSLAAAQTIEQPGSAGNPAVYQPITSGGLAGLELNEGNATEGDMTSGSYGVNPNYDATQLADEDADYNRRDFTISSGPAAASAPAFLVRMRRTNNVNGLDQEAGVSSAGPALPFLWGRGSLLARSGASNQLSVVSGITVRATAIAGPQPAKSVGPAYINTGGTVAASPQLAPFALRSDVWASLAAAGGTANITVDPLATGSGAIVLDNQFRLKLTAIGQPLAASTDETTLSAGPQPTSAYVPIYADFGSQPETIVGFAYYTNWSFRNGNLTLSTADPTVRIGGQNVSAAMVLSLPPAVALSDAAALFQANTAMSSQHPLYAPALVNRYLGPNSP